MSQQSVRTIVAPYRVYYKPAMRGPLADQWFLRQEETEYETGERTIVSNIPTPANDGFVTLIRRFDADGVQRPDERIDHDGIYPPAAPPPLTLT